MNNQFKCEKCEYNTNSDLLLEIHELIKHKESREKGGPDFISWFSRNMILLLICGYVAFGSSVFIIIWHDQSTRYNNLLGYWEGTVRTLPCANLNELSKLHEGLWFDPDKPMGDYIKQRMVELKC